MRLSLPTISGSLAYSSFQAAAKRELLEETGLTVSKFLFEPFVTFFESSYINPNTGKTKVVVVWPAEVAKDAEIVIQPEEIMSYRYVNIDEASSVLSFEADRQSLKRLIALLRLPV